MKHGSVGGYRRLVRSWGRALVGAAVLAGATRADATVFVWRERGALHVANDPAAVPSGTQADRYTARPAPPSLAPAGSGSAEQASNAAAIAPAASCQPGACPPAASTYPGSGRVSAPAVAPASAAAAPSLVFAPTLVVRGGAPTLTYVDVPAWWAGYAFLPSGFIGHEHPQVGFLAGTRLVPHSHFFAHGRPGRFTPWGHFSTHGVLVDLSSY